MSISKINIKGSQQIISNTTADDPLQPVASFSVGSSLRASIESYDIELKKDDVVEMVFEDGTVWYGNADTLEDVFPEALDTNRSGEMGFTLPSTLDNDSTDRSLVGDAVLKLFNVFSKKKLSTEIKKLAEDLEKKQLDNMSGLYKVDSSYHLSAFNASESDKPWFLFLHGTASSSSGSFAELVGSDLWQYIHTQYAGQVLAFQHETLTKSPLQNVFELLEQLPKSGALHIISHSRGGLVGEVLARFCNGSELNKGFDANEIALLKKEDRNDDLKYIAAIETAMKDRKLFVEKFIRVACPASGTTLASGRLDNFFNVSINLLGLATGAAANPVFISFRALASAVINCKNDVNTLPGLEAMSPDSVFIKVLNNPSGKVVLDNPLAIISGNCKTKFNLKALLIIASRIFFQKNNDLVVNTASMHNGTQRLTRVQYFLDADTNVDHFHYFKNSDTQKAMLDALKTVADNAIPGFQLLQKDDEVLDRNAILKLEGGQVHPEPVTGTKPIVVILPGIMGSNLSYNDNLIWINYLRFLAGELGKIEIKSPNIEAPSLIRTSYLKLVKYLRNSYDVLVFPFDWRLQLNESAGLFAKKIETLLTYNQPIKLIGHSMGGVLVRDFMVTQPATWKKLNESPGFRLIFLGSPLGGSFRIPSVLFGNDAIIDKLSKIDIFHSKRDLLEIFIQFPGLLSLLPFSTDSDNDFANAAVWKKMKDAHGDKGWPQPETKDLANFKAYREGVAKGMKDEFYNNAIYIAGKDKATPCGYRIDETSNGKQLFFLSTGEGDQSVTWDTGIPPAMTANDKVYFVNVSHGALANEPILFKGIEELLLYGSTTQSMFSKTRPVVRGSQKLFKSPVIDDMDLSPLAIENTLLGLTAQETEMTIQTELNVSVVNGDLRYASYPVLAGHFLNDGITSAEWHINRWLNYTLSDHHKLGIYPGIIGSSELFLKESNSGFTGALIVGLGSPTQFTAYELTQTIQQGVSKYLLDILKCGVDKNRKNGKIGLSSLLVGSGYGGLTIENAVRAIIQGVQNANLKISSLSEAAMPVIENLEFVELYEDNALNSFYSLRRVAHENDGQLKLNVCGQINTVLGKRRRIMMSSGEFWWNRISVKVESPINSISRQPFVYTASTGAARDMARTIFVNPSLVSEILDEISTSNNWSKELAKTIFELLIPNDFKEQLKRRSNTIWILDESTASYPWELLQDRVSEARPLCVNAGMIRQLSEKEGDFSIKNVYENNALVVGDPFLNGFITQLPGAYAEAELVTKLFKENQFNVTDSLKEKSAQIINKLFSKDYKLIHLAGHGLYNAKDPAASGMVIGDHVFLTTAEIAQMSAIPEFVFVNCCYLGKTEGGDETLYRQRYKLAANIGTQLIKNGVRAVVVAGWAIDDRAAHEFAKVFYSCMFAGDSFGDAVRKARRHCYDKFGSNNNTWGAYQCYGDPFYQFDTRHSNKVDKENYVIAEEAEIDLENLRTAIEMGQETDLTAAEKLNNISRFVDKAGIRNGAITELEAFIFSDLMSYEDALNKFDTLLNMEDAHFYVSTLESFCNCKVKNSITLAGKNIINNQKAIEAIDKVVAELLNLLYISPTAERYSLLGSTYKRKSMLYNTFELKEDSLIAAAFNYWKASEKNREAKIFYPLTNWYLIEFFLVQYKKRKWGSAVKVGDEKFQIPSLNGALSRLCLEKKSLSRNARKGISYNEMASGLNIRFCEMVLDSDSFSDKDWDALLNDYRILWSIISTNAKKMSELEQLSFVMELLNGINSKKMDNLHNRVKKLKEGLEKLMEEF
ncbi:MAG TPA: CHAT domain-containing protein [Ferruginibacter sp.]|nr:CHAT domain-containing protein [Ferruginibacter sp.]